MLGPVRLSGTHESFKVKTTSEAVRPSGIRDEGLVGCFVVPPGELHGAVKARLTLRLVEVPDGLAVAIGACTPRAGESPARGLGPEGPGVRSRAINVAWLRQKPSYRERLFAGIGYGTLTTGVVLLGSTKIVGRLRRQRGEVQSVSGVP